MPPVDAAGAAGRARRIPLDPRDRRDWLEEAVRDAEARGLFHDLPGRGRPLDLAENPYEPEAWRLTHRLLRGHGFAPEWIELDKEIREGLEAARAILREALALRARRAEAMAATAPERDAGVDRAVRRARGGRWPRLPGWARWRRRPLPPAPPQATSPEAEEALVADAERRFRARVAELNARIARFNLIVPIPWLQRRKIDVEAELAAFRRAWWEADRADEPGPG